MSRDGHAALADAVNELWWSDGPCMPSEVDIARDVRDATGIEFDPDNLPEDVLADMTFEELLAMHSFLARRAKARAASAPSDLEVQAYALLRAMTEAQRARVLCWFCSSCWRYVGPGDSCTCTRDD
jgi:hypothetical protein